MKSAVLEPPKVSTAMMKKYGGKRAIAWKGKIIYIGDLSKQALEKLKKKYPHINEEEYVYTFIPGNKLYILSCRSAYRITKTYRA